MFKSFFNSIKSLISGNAEPVVVEPVIEEPVVAEEPTVEETAAPVNTIADKATVVLNNISAAKADAEAKAAHYTAEVVKIDKKISDIQAEIVAAEVTLAQLKPIADLYQDGAAEIAAAKLVEAKKAAEIAKARVLTLHIEAAKLTEKATELYDISRKAAEIANKGGELSGLTNNLKGLISKTQYKIEGLDELDAEVSDISTRYSRASGIATTANAAALQRLADVKQALKIAEAAVNEAVASVNVALQTAKVAKAAEEAVAQTVVSATVAHAKNKKLKELEDRKFTAAKAAYETSQDAENLAAAEAIGVKVVDKAKNLSEKIREYESQINKALCCLSREDAKASLISSGIFTDTEAEEILDANW